MTPENFCYWLKGYVELRSQETDGLGCLEPSETKRIFEEVSNHLDLVFNKVTPAVQPTIKYPMSYLSGSGSIDIPPASC